MTNKRFFKRPANRLCAWFNGFGPVPVAQAGDDAPEFLTEKPRRIGDEALIRAEGKVRRVIFERSAGGGNYLLDMGPA
jgi:hypothetical protein